MYASNAHIHQLSYFRIVTYDHFGGKNSSRNRMWNILQQYFEVNCKLHRLGYCTRRDYLYRPKRELLKKFDGYSLRKKCRQRFNEQHQARQWFWMKKYKDEIMPARSLCCCIYATGGSMLKIRDVVEHVVSKRLSSGQVAI